nr:MAG TPA: hypothetical protein [Caudoviricetes sp.]
MACATLLASCILGYLIFKPPEILVMNQVPFRYFYQCDYLSFDSR